MDQQQEPQQQPEEYSDEQSEGHSEEESEGQPRQQPEQQPAQQLEQQPDQQQRQQSPDALTDEDTSGQSGSIDSPDFDEIRNYLDANEILSEKARAIEREYAKLEEFRSSLESEKLLLDESRTSLEKQESLLEESRSAIEKQKFLLEEFRSSLEKRKLQLDEREADLLRREELSSAQQVSPSLKAPQLSATVKQNPNQPPRHSTIREDSAENDENNSPIYHTPDAERKLSRCRTIDEEDTGNDCDDSRGLIKVISNNQETNHQDDDLIPRQTPPRSYPRQSIGQWSVERVRNNLSVRSLVSSLEGKTGRKGGGTGEGPSVRKNLK